ncbi:MAG: ABC transporter, partial [Polaromonas sp.]
MQHNHPVEAAGTIDPALAGLGSQLATDENVLCTLPVDLDQQLRFAAGLLALTDRRLLARNEEGVWSSWLLRNSADKPAQALSLRHFDHAGVGALELHEAAGEASRRLASWRFTLGVNVQAQRLLRLFVQQQASAAAPINFAAQGSPRADLPLCPECGLPLPPDSDQCPACAPPVPSPPSTWVLLRLWRFARPYRYQLLSGFLLTLASTAATLVPPYLTIPLMDDILIPFQNGQQIEAGKVGLILGGL